jgi:hypothetical protein
METLVEREENDLSYVLENVKSWDPKKTLKLIKHLSILTEAIHERLPEYDTIIGDDVKGRLLALFYREIINRERKRKGLDLVNTHFLTPKRAMHPKVNEGISNFIGSKNMKKVLLVTEYVESGYSLAPMVRALNANEIPFDIVALSDSNVRIFKNLNKETRDIKSKVIAATIGTVGLNLFGNEILTGIAKDRKDDESIHAYRPILYKPDREKVNQARRDISLIADYVYENLDSTAALATAEE